MENQVQNSNNMNKIKVKKEALKELLQNEASWVAQGLDPNKGILLMGKVGTGKTTAMKEYLRAQPKRGWELNAIEIASEFNIYGPGVVRKYLDNNHMIFIDDIGMESPSTHYGVTTRPAADIIIQRYSTERGNKVHFTTNKNLEDLGSIYGERIKDRLIEMVNIIHVEGDSWRV
jgi:DNA replication protein DnaC